MINEASRDADDKRHVPNRYTRHLRWTIYDSTHLSLITVCRYRMLQFGSITFRQRGNSLLSVSMSSTSLMSTPESPFAGEHSELALLRSDPDIFPRLKTPLVT